MKNTGPKPTTASILAPPSPSKLPANVQATAEITRLQSELLQLHLLHRDADEVDFQWRHSAHKKLSERFTQTVRSSAEIGDRERDAVEERNTAVLKSWLEGSSGGAGLNQSRPEVESRATLYGTEEKIQALDVIVSGLWSLGETGGKYSRIMRRFERWVGWVEEAIQLRSQSRFGSGLLALLEAHPADTSSLLDEGQTGSNNSEYDCLFVGGLDDTWKEECAAIYRKLDGWRRTLRDIGDVPEKEQGDADKSSSSALSQILAGCRALVHNMLAELDAMEKIERDAVIVENEWVKKMNREDDTVEDRTQRAGGIWRHM